MLKMYLFQQTFFKSLDLTVHGELEAKSKIFSADGAMTVRKINKEENTWKSVESDQKLQLRISLHIHQLVLVIRYCTLIILYHYFENCSKKSFNMIKFSPCYINKVNCPHLPVVQAFQILRERWSKITWAASQFTSSIGIPAQLSRINLSSWLIERRVLDFVLMRFWQLNTLSASAFPTITHKDKHMSLNIPGEKLHNYKPHNFFWEQWEASQGNSFLRMYFLARNLYK